MTRIGSKATDPQGEGGVNLFGACIEREHDYSRRAVTNKTIKKIVIPDTVEEIQPSSFCGMIALKSIKIPKKVKALKEETFYACAGLEEVSLPAGLEKLDPAAFQDCPSLKKMGLPKKNKIFRMEGDCGEDWETHCGAYERAVRNPAGGSDSGHRPFYLPGLL